MRAISQEDDIRALLNYAWAPEIDDGNDEPFWAGEEVSKPYVSSLHQEISSKTEYLTKNTSYWGHGSDGSFVA